MSIRDLPKRWEQGESKNKHTQTQDHDMKLPLEDAARLKALAELFPDRTEEQLLNDLANEALGDLQRILDKQKTQ